MKIYQLSAKGTLALTGDISQCSSKRVFLFRRNAEAFIPEFRKIMTTPRDKLDFGVVLDDDFLEITIHELEWKL
jgi:hypothetical protein